MNQQRFSRSLAVAIGLLFLSPLIQPMLINPTEVPWYTIPFFFTAGFAAYLFTTRTRIVFYNVLLPPLALGSLPILLHLQESSPSSALFHLVFLVSVSSAVIMALNTSPKQSTRLFATYCVAAFVWSILAIVVWIGVTRGDLIHIGMWALTTVIGPKINGPFANGNVFGILAFCAWSISLWFWLKQKRTLHPLWLAAMVFFWSMGIASLGRGAWMAHLLVVAITLLVLGLKSRRHLLPFMIAFTLALFLGSYLGGKGDTASHPVSGQFETTQQEGFGSRLLLWSSVIEVWKEHPWLGTGYGKLGAHYLTGQYHAFEKHRFDNHGLGATAYAHNTPLHLLAEGGLLGGALALIISLILLAALYLNWKRIHSVAWPATMIAAMLWFQGMGNISMTRPFPILLFCLALGISVRAPLRKHFDKIEIKKRHLALSAILTMLILSSGAYAQTRAWHAYGEWHFAKNSSDMNRRNLIALLLSNDSTMPYFVGETVSNSLNNPAQRPMTLQLIPYIHAALKKLETPQLYQGLFFTQAMEGEMARACETGKFLTMQNWNNDYNHSYYRAACDGTLDPRTFEIRPKGASAAGHPMHP